VILSHGTTAWQGPGADAGAEVIDRYLGTAPAARSA
jgi:hypothetical protein